MIPILKNKAKIEIFSQIQQNLLSLKGNSDSSLIIELINQIPHFLLTQKDDLKVICSLFASYSRSSHHSTSNSIKLFQYIIPYLKLYLNDESSFLYDILHGLSFYFRLWMYREKLISFEQIILNSHRDKSLNTAKYFLPEFFHHSGEFFEYDIKYVLKSNCTEKDILRFESLREKHIFWLQNGNDNYNTEIYYEIETNKLRLSIKTDNVDLFQRTLSNMNISINSKISESVLDLTEPFDNELSLIEYSVYYNAIHVFKFLIMNGAKIENDKALIYSIYNNNYEIFHFIESSVGIYDHFDVLCFSISQWNFDIIEYLMDNYLFFDNITNKDKNELFEYCFIHSNFIYFQNTIIPFLQNNSMFIEENKKFFAPSLVNDLTCFFLNEFFDFLELDLETVLGQYIYIYMIFKSVYLNNTKAVQFLFENHDMYLLLNELPFGILDISIVIFANMEIVKLICNHPKMNKKKLLFKTKYSSFEMALYLNNYLAAEYLFNNFTRMTKTPKYLIISNCLLDGYFLSVKISLLYFFTYSSVDYDRLIVSYYDYFVNNEIFNEDYILICRQIFNETKIQVKYYPQYKEQQKKRKKFFFLLIILCLFAIILKVFR